MKGHPVKKRNKYTWLLFVVFVIFVVCISIPPCRNLEQELGLGHDGKIRERIRRIENEALDPGQRLPPSDGIKARIARCESLL